MLTDQIKAIESDLKQAFREQLVEMHPMLGRDMHNRPPLYDVKSEHVEEIESWFLSFFRAKLIALLENDVERLEGEKRNQENKNGTECGACGESYPAICGCKDINRFIDQELAHRRAAIKALKTA